MKYETDFVIAENHKTGRIYMFFTKNIISCNEKKCFLNPFVSNNLNKILADNAELFINDEKFSKECEGGNLFLLLNAITSRLESAVEYINRHSKVPKTEEQVYLFMLYACMICDAVTGLRKELSNYTEQVIEENETNYFKSICMGEPWNLNEKECLSDKEFFEHFRALSFAHPYKTTGRSIIKQKYGRQYSPLVIVDSKKHPGKVGLHIYSGKEEGTKILRFDFALLKQYVKSRYSEISCFFDIIREIIDNRKKELAEIKVVRDSNPLKTLQDLIRVSECRCHFYHGQIETLIEFIQYKNSIPENEFVAKTYIQAIKDIITHLCDAIDNAKYMKAQRLIDSVLCAYSYKDSKISSYMREISDYYCHPAEEKMKTIRIMAKKFSKTYSKSIVTIDADTMDIKEIYFLSCASCFVSKKQKELSK